MFELGSLDQPFFEGAPSKAKKMPYILFGEKKVKSTGGISNLIFGDNENASEALRFQLVEDYSIEMPSELTKFPVQSGVEMSDHYRLRGIEVKMTCYVSNSNVTSLGTFVASPFSNASKQYVAALSALRKSKEVIELYLPDVPIISTNATPEDDAYGGTTELLDGLKENFGLDDLFSENAEDGATGSIRVMITGISISRNGDLTDGFKMDLSFTEVLEVPKVAFDIYDVETASRSQAATEDIQTGSSSFDRPISDQYTACGGGAACELEALETNRLNQKAQGDL